MEKLSALLTDEVVHEHTALAIPMGVILGWSVQTGLSENNRLAPNIPTTHRPRVSTGSPYAAPSGARRVPNVYKLGIDKNKIILYNER